MAILTGGGDTPALNATIKAIRDIFVLKGYRVLGIRRGWKGLTGKGDILDISHVSLSDSYGGTVLRSSRTNPFADGQELRRQEVLSNIQNYSIDMLVAIGGDDTIGAARNLYEAYEIPVMAFPKTIDNDLRTQTAFIFNDQEQEVVLCPGFPSAADGVMTYINRLKTYALSHERILVVETMGRDAGWLTGAAQLARADFSLVPEFPMDKNSKEAFLNAISTAYKQSPYGFLLVAVAEGVKWYDEQKQQLCQVHASTEQDDFGHPALGGVSGVVAAEIRKATGYPAKGIVSGFFARSGKCGDYDQKLVIALAEKLCEAVEEGQSGKMVVPAVLNAQSSIKNFQTKTISLLETGSKTLPDAFYDASAFRFTKPFEAFMNLITSEKNEKPFDIRDVENLRVRPAG